jgi:hypothetical protein
MSNRTGNVRWETPVSDARSLTLVSLSDDGELQVTVQGDSNRQRVRFSFFKVVAYRNILEEYRTSEHGGDRHVGWTRIVLDSAWLAELRSREPLIDVHAPGCQHYVIATEDDVIDILTPKHPAISEV